MLYKITSMDDVTSSIVNPREKLEYQSKWTFTIFLAAANVIAIIFFFVLADDFFNPLM